MFLSVRPMNPGDDYDTESSDDSNNRVNRGAGLREYTAEAPSVDIFRKFCTALGRYDAIYRWLLLSDNNDIDPEGVKHNTCYCPLNYACIDWLKK